MMTHHLPPHSVDANERSHLNGMMLNGGRRCGPGAKMEVSNLVGVIQVMNGMIDGMTCPGRPCHPGAKMATAKAVLGRKTSKAAETISYPSIGKFCTLVNDDVCGPGSPVVVCGNARHNGLLCRT